MEADSETAPQSQHQQPSSTVNNLKGSRKRKFKYTKNGRPVSSAWNAQSFADTSDDQVYRAKTKLVRVVVVDPADDADIETEADDSELVADNADIEDSNSRASLTTTPASPIVAVVALQASVGSVAVSTKRRSGRVTARKTVLYNDDERQAEELKMLEQEDEGETVEEETADGKNAALEDNRIVEKILGIRRIKRPVKRPSARPTPQPPPPPPPPPPPAENDQDNENKKTAASAESDTVSSIEKKQKTPAESEAAEEEPTVEEKQQQQQSESEAKPAEKVNADVADKTETGLIVEQSNSEEQEQQTEAAAATIAAEADVKSEASTKREAAAEDDEEEEDEEEVEEFYVKYKGFSYLHCEWRTADEIDDPRIAQKIKRYLGKQAREDQDDPTAAAAVDDDDEELFNPDYVEVDRVLDCQTINGQTYYLVKWRSMSYEDATWELTQDVPPAKIKEFTRNSQPPDEAGRRKMPRPDNADAWLGRQIEAGRVYKGGNELRDYQLEGVNWLTFCWYQKRNCILADEMGLGKTVQSITFLKEVHDYGIQGPFLVIVPLSTIGNWQREFDNWTDMNVVVYHGSTSSRVLLQQYEVHHRDVKENIIKNCFKFHALITTYEILMTDIEFFGEIEWRIAIIDEAHRLKNKKCKLGEGLRYLDLEHRVLLTGTPLQNNVEELFSLLNFLEPERFSCSQAFLAEFGDLKTESQVDNLKAILKPMMLRRLKEDVEKSIAPKEETIVEVELTNIQKKYYRAILERNFTFLSKGATSNNTPNLMNTMMELRKCCNHPFLIKGAEDNIMSELRHQYQDMESQEYQFQAMVYASGKLVLVHKLLPKLLQGGHKVLVFSQMIRVLDIIEDFLIHMKFQYERIDGRIHGLQRQEAIDRFSNDPNKFVFLLCTKAGGLGINLTAADTVIIYDSDWNPQNDLQAQARCHRIGQEKSVKVYRLITRNTYEREMFDRASLKLGLDKAVLQNMGTSKDVRSAQPTKKDIEELLKKGAYGALMDDDNASDKFCEEDIDQILMGRTTTIQIESGEKGSTFSKASFSMTNNRTDIDLDDPEFWHKWAQKAGVDDSYFGANKDLIMDLPRQRRQTTRYVANEGSYEVGSEFESDSNSNCSSGSGRRERRSKRRRPRRQLRHRRKTLAKPKPTVWMTPRRKPTRKLKPMLNRKRRTPLLTPASPRLRSTMSP